MNTSEPSGFTAWFIGLIGAAVGGFAGAYTWMRKQVVDEVERTTRSMREEIDHLKKRVDNLEIGQDLARTELMQAYGLALSAGHAELAQKIMDAEKHLR